MDVRDDQFEPRKESFRLLKPQRRTTPLLVASPHSGTWYPPQFLEQSALDPHTLRRSEDTFVDILFQAAPKLGAPLLTAVCARAYVDLNREPYELDPAMFTGDLPSYVNTSSSRVAAGLGTIARDVADGAEIYRRKLFFADVRERIESVYRPYHDRLSALIDETVDAFGYCLLFDGHSMPTMDDRDAADVVLGDRHGLSCSPALTSHVENFLAGEGLRVVRNTPYAGGHTTSYYGSPCRGVHALQIELARRLYMNEATHEPLPGLESLGQMLERLMVSVSALPRELFRP